VKIEPEDLELYYIQSGAEYVWEIRYLGIPIDKSHKPCSYEAMHERWVQTVIASQTFH